MMFSNTVFLNRLIAEIIRGKVLADTNVDINTNHIAFGKDLRELNELMYFFSELLVNIGFNNTPDDIKKINEMMASIKYEKDQPASMALPFGEQSIDLIVNTKVQNYDNENSKNNIDVSVHIQMGDSQIFLLKNNQNKHTDARFVLSVEGKTHFLFFNDSTMYYYLPESFAYFEDISKIPKYIGPDTVKPFNDRYRKISSCIAFIKEKIPDLNNNNFLNPNTSEKQPKLN